MCRSNCFFIFSEKKVKIRKDISKPFRMDLTDQVIKGFKLSYTQLIKDTLNTLDLTIYG